MGSTFDFPDVHFRFWQEERQMLRNQADADDWLSYLSGMRLWVARLYYVLPSLRDCMYYETLQRKAYIWESELESRKCHKIIVSIIGCPLVSMYSLTYR